MVEDIPFGHYAGNLGPVSPPSGGGVAVGLVRENDLEPGPLEPDVEPARAREQRDGGQARPLLETTQHLSPFDRPPDLPTGDGSVLPCKP